MSEHIIITFGLTAEENCIIDRNKPQSDYEIIDTDEPTDIIAIKSIISIVKASALDDDAMSFIFDFYNQVNGCTDETVIWLGDPLPPKNLTKFFKCYKSFEAIEDKLKYILLNAHSRSKKTCEYSKKLVSGLKILALIRNHPGISSQELADKTELSVRSVQRYISTLQAAGEWIEYDRTLKGWKLFHGISSLFGEVWDGEWE